MGILKGVFTQLNLPPIGIKKFKSRPFFMTDFCFFLFLIFKKKGNRGRLAIETCLCSAVPLERATMNI